jgi:hypothetical protein
MWVELPAGADEATAVMASGDLRRRSSVAGDSAVAALPPVRRWTAPNLPGDAEAEALVAAAESKPRRWTAPTVRFADPGELGEAYGGRGAEVNRLPAAISGMCDVD